MTPQAIASRLSEVAANNNASDKQFAANLGRFVNEFLYYGAEGDGPRAELYDGSARADLLATMQDMIDYDAYGFTGASDDDMWLAVCLYVQEHMVSAVDRVADFNDYVDELVSERAASDDAAPARSYAHPLALFDAVPAEGDTVEVPSKSIFTDPKRYTLTVTGVEVKYPQAGRLAHVVVTMVDEDGIEHTYTAKAGSFSDWEAYTDAPKKTLLDYKRENPDAWI